MKRQSNRLMVFLGLLLSAGFLITSLASYYVSRSSLRTQISESELPLTSDNIYSEIQRDLILPVFISSMMASDTFLRDWVIRGEGSVDEIERYLSEIKKTYGTFTSFFVSEKTRIYYYSGGILKKVLPDEQRDAWYFRVRTMKDNYEINVDPDMANNDTMTIFINYRVFDYKGDFIGATGVGLKVRTVKELIDTYQKNYGSNIYFINKKGDIVLHGDVFPSKVKKFSDFDGITPFFQRITSAGIETFRYEKNHHLIHVNTRYIPEFDWYLIVERPEERTVKDILYALFVNLSICLAITVVVLIVTYMTIAAFQKRLEKAAATDNLTGTYNRYAFDIVIGETIKEYRRSGDTFSVIMLDIDHFKKINDRYGHLAGDDVLKHIIGVVQKDIRKSDVCCRWGGEEFLVLLKKCDIEAGFKIAEKIRNDIEASFTKYDGTGIKVTVSIGITEFTENDTTDDLIGRADRAMYSAKQKGRNRSERESKKETTAL